MASTPDTGAAAYRVAAIYCLAEFYPLYLGEHSNRTYCRLQFFCSTLGPFCST